MIIQNRDGSLVWEPGDARHSKSRKQRYSVELPAAALDGQSALIDRVISFAFDTVGARQLRLRVRDAE